MNDCNKFNVKNIIEIKVNELNVNRKSRSTGMWISMAVLLVARKCNLMIGFNWPLTPSSIDKFLRRSTRWDRNDEGIALNCAYALPTCRLGTYIRLPLYKGHWLDIFLHSNHLSYPILATGNRCCLRTLLITDTYTITCILGTPNLFIPTV